ncbi:unnamed protein product, partial [Polarella glacialis]
SNPDLEMEARSWDVSSNIPDLEMEACDDVKAPSAVKLELRLTDPWNIGLTMNKFVAGFVLGSLYPAQNGLLLGYFNMDGYLFGTSKSLWESPRILIVLFGIISDSKPIMGRRRGPYMAIGCFC